MRSNSSSALNSAVRSKGVLVRRNSSSTPCSRSRRDGVEVSSHSRSTSARSSSAEGTKVSSGSRSRSSASRSKRGNNWFGGGSGGDRGCWSGGSDRRRRSNGRGKGSHARSSGGRGFGEGIEVRSQARPSIVLDWGGASRGKCVKIRCPTCRSRCRWHGRLDGTLADGFQVTERDSRSQGTGQSNDGKGELHCDLFWAYFAWRLRLWQKKMVVVVRTEQQQQIIDRRSLVWKDFELPNQPIIAQERLPTSTDAHTSLPAGARAE